MLIAYLESVAGRPNLREDHKGFTISVDADYGTGKSFFLKRLSRHLASSHPVAFVDAWADDLADDPLTAIAATLKKALTPYASNAAVQASFQKVTAKVGNIAKIVGKGLLKKGVALALTESGAEELFKALPSEEDQTTALEALSDAATIVGDGVVDGALRKTPSNLMADRIADFEAGQQAIQELKESLADLVMALDESEHHAPIVVIIDELDRCRPPYAIKLLEELKHLFDVPGLVFILGLNSTQLTKSIRAAYGHDFDSHAYLRRFIDRKFFLPHPDLLPLLTTLVDTLKVDTSRMEFPAVIDDNVERNPDCYRMLSRYMEAYGLTPRDAFSFVDLLQTSLALTTGSRLYMPYLLPLLISHLKGSEGGAATLISEPSWKFVVSADMTWENVDSRNSDDYFREIQNRLNWGRSSIMTSYNSGDKFSEIVFDKLYPEPVNRLSSIRNYRELVRGVGRFS